MAGEQQLHQLSIEQFVTAQDAQAEAQNSANQKFQDQLHGLTEGRSIPPAKSVPTLESDHVNHADENTNGRKHYPDLEAIERGESVPAQPGMRMDALSDGKSTIISDADGKVLALEFHMSQEDRPSLFEDIETFHKSWPRKLTAEDRAKAKDVLGKEISPLINEADSKTLKSLQEAIVDGNVGKLAETLKSMPLERAKAFIKELNKELKEHHAGVELSATGDGRIFVYEKSGQTAIQVNRDGTTQLKPIRHNYDGSIVVEPGEIINKDAEEVMKGISDAAVRGITGGDRIIWPEKPEYPRKPLPFYPKPRVEFPPIEWPEGKPDLDAPPTWKPLLWHESKPDSYELLNRPFWTK